jgi:hypothetical protein
MARMTYFIRHHVESPVLGGNPGVTRLRLHPAKRQNGHACESRAEHHKPEKPVIEHARESWGQRCIHLTTINPSTLLSLPFLTD